VGRIHRVHTMGPEFMGFGPLTTIVDDAAGRPEPMAPKSIGM
jgi:hypothetical protein